jgi:hypothetical protein
MASLASPFMYGMDQDYIEINDDKLKQDLINGWDPETGYQKLNQFS